MKQLLQNQPLTIFIIFLITTAIFISNFFIPLGMIVWVFFILPILLVYLTQPLKYLLPFVGFISLLIIINLFTTTSLIPLEYAVFNRSSGIIIFFTIALMLKLQSKINSEKNKTEQKYSGLFKNMMEGYAYCQMIYKDNNPEDFIYLEVNEKFTELTGLKNVEGKRVTEVIPGIRQQDDELFKIYSRVAQTGKSEKFEMHVQALNMWFSISVYSPEKEYFIAVFEVINKRKLTEIRQKLALNVVEILNRQNELKNLIGDILHLIKEHTKFEAVAIRIKQGEDYPYVAHEGFTKEFIQKENFLCAKDDEGRIIRDKDGKPLLEGMCGTILSGYTAIEKSYFTERGSFWVNESRKFNITTTDEQRMIVARNYCQSDFESLALVPIRSNGDIIGLIQFCDKKKNLFNPDMLEYLESLAHSIGVAMKRIISEENLKDTLERFKIAAHSAAIAVWERDLNTDFITFSEEFKNIYGINENIFRIEFAELNSFIYPQDIEYVKSKREEVIEKDEQVNYEFRIQRKDGTIRYIKAFTKISKNIHGKPTKLVGIDMDITEQKLADILLKEKEEKYHSLFENSEIGILLTTPDGGILSANEYICLKLGRSEEEICRIGRNGIVDQTDKRLQTLLVERDKNGKAKGELRFVRKDGTIFECEISSVVFYDSEGRKKTSMVVRDMTEQKRAEAAIKESEEKFRVITEGSADAIFIVNKDGKYVYANEMAVKLLNYSKEELLSKTILDLSPKSISEDVLKLFGELMLKGRVHKDIDFLKKDGSLLPVDLNAVLLPNGLAFGSCRDISERKKSEQELIKAKNKAEESDRLKSSFLSNMSHEVRTPMNAIMGFTQLMGDDEDEINRKEYLRIINSSCNQLLTIIDDILDISIIEAKQLKIKKESVDINQILYEVKAIFSPKIDMNKVRFEIHSGFSNKNSKVIADNVRLKQIISNLAANAVKFTHKGNIDIGYSLKGGMIEFFVKDTGKGISPDHHKLIFERFRQVETTTTRNTQGNGLGLAISKSLVELFGGQMWLESEINKGSEFYFTIPYLPTEEKSVDKKKEGITINKKLKFKKVLVVEDYPDNSKLINFILKRLELTTINASNGLEALEIFHKNPDIDIVLLDIMMPEMDGYEIAKRMKNIRDDVVIIAQTAYAMPEDRGKALASGCDEYISKPIDKNKLIALLNKMSV